MFCRILANLKPALNLSKLLLTTSTMASRTAQKSDIGHMRAPYRNDSDVFDVKDLVSWEPYAQFEEWFSIAKNHGQIPEANAVCLATSTKEGVPSARMVLIKEFGPDGFVFHTHYTSRKGQELQENPNASIVFYWEPLHRSVRIEGTVAKATKEESDKYFQYRPRESMIGSACSNQSKVIESRQVLIDRQAELRQLYGDEKKPMPRPEMWGGFRITPHTFIFWQGQSNRIHDNIRFRKRKPDEKIDPILTKEGKDGWLIERLSP